MARNEDREINVALVGTKFMGKAHSHAYNTVASIFPDCPRVRKKVIVGRDPEYTAVMAARFGWEEASTNWEEVVQRDDIEAVDISVHGALHAPIAIAAARAGKAVLCEKPLANNMAEAQQMLDAVRKAGVVNAIQFNYRRVPAVIVAQQLIEEGRIGQVYHFRARYLQEWGLPSAEVPAVWRFERAEAGSGALGDLGAHIVDLCRYLVGDIDEVAAMMETFVKERPALSGEGRVAVTVDDAALFIGRLKNGGTASFESSRLAPGRLNQNVLEINGSKGSLYFDLEQLNELHYFSVDDPAHARGFRRISVTERVHPYWAHWWPQGHIIGWEHSHTHMIHDFLQGVASGHSPRPNFEDGVKCQAVLDAVERASESRRWETVGAQTASA